MEMGGDKSSKCESSPPNIHWKSHDRTYNISREKTRFLEIKICDRTTKDDAVRDARGEDKVASPGRVLIGISYVSYRNK